MYHLTFTKSYLTSAKMDLAATKSDLAAAKLNLAATKLNLTSTKMDLAATKLNLAATKSDLAAAKMDLTSTKMDLAATKLNLAATKSDLAATKLDLTTTKLDLVVTKLNLTATKLDLTSEKITAKTLPLQKHQFQTVNRFLAISSTLQYLFNAGFMRFVPSKPVSSPKKIFNFQPSLRVLRRHFSIFNFQFSILICLLLWGLLPATASAAPKDTIQVVAVGDIMMGTIFPNGEYLPPSNDCSRSFSQVLPYFANADILFGNLEGAMTDSKVGAKSCNNPEWCYTFGMPTEFSRCLVEAGFNILSIANNHMGDFGEQGRNSTVQTLTKAGIRHAGLLSCPTVQFVKDGIKYGFCAFAPNTGTVDVKDIPAAQEIVRQLNDSCDIVIVSFHAGAEGKTYQHVTRQTENFIGENRGNVYEFTHKMIDAGGDILLGHGPHVTRAVEVYNNRFIAYSMGNFSTVARVNVEGVNGLAPIFRIYTMPNGCFLKAHITPTCQPADDRTPRYDSAHRVVSVIQSLTRADFPEVKIQITDDGWVTIPDGYCAERIAPLKPVGIKTLRSLDSKPHGLLRRVRP